ncbi:hypothetical protein KVA01_23520 [Kocuria varians]|uniref:Uncharacterized protein n=1 Tax=Kocuria varians TaxID=1272 RepID=A0A4Y4DA85_KOCVA|nr:hypothetical protein KVA01_23520 [Kocuria varians]
MVSTPVDNSVHNLWGEHTVAVRVILRSCGRQLRGAPAPLSMLDGTATPVRGRGRTEFGIKGDPGRHDCPRS